MHQSLILDAQSGRANGCAEVTLRSRTQEADEHYQSLPIEEKEFYRFELFIL